jgi:ribosomal protein S2
MGNVTFEMLWKSGSLGHLTRKWNPIEELRLMAKRIHIIDVTKTIECLDEAPVLFVKSSGRAAMFCS